MIKVENIDTWGFEHAIRGMRNPMNSWGKSDTLYCDRTFDCNPDNTCPFYDYQNGGCSGAFSIAAARGMEHPVLLSGTDGVGTKLKLAFVMNKYDTVGIDCVAMCVNDVACAGGEPLFFLDYIACGKNYPERIADIVKGVSDGCVQAGAALIGGETAEMPGFYPEDEFDLAGFAVGLADEKDLINGENLKDGDVLIGLASTGVHSNGFSLVRKIFDMTPEAMNAYDDKLGKTVGEALLAPTRIYVRALREIKNAGAAVKACSHITGGGFYENVPRMLRDGTRAVAPDKRGDAYWTAMINEVNKLAEQFETLNAKYCDLAPKYGKHGPIENALSFILAVASDEEPEDPQDAA